MIKLTQTILSTFLEDYERYIDIRDEIKDWKVKILAEYEDGEHEVDGQIITIKTHRTLSVKKAK